MERLPGVVEERVCDGARLRAVTVQVGGKRWAVRGDVGEGASEIQEVIYFS